MIYQYPQPWLQTFWQQQVQPPKPMSSSGNALGSMAPSAGMPMGMRKKPGQGLQINPMRPGMTPTANAFAHPAAMFSGAGGFAGMAVPRMKGY